MPKRNFIKKIKQDKKENFNTVFHIGINSDALFKLSDGALKLYIMFILNGKKTPPSLRVFSNRINKSERTVSRYYDELKEFGFLKMICVKPKVYQYIFDSNGGLIEMETKKIEKKIEKEIQASQETIDITKHAEEIVIKKEVRENEYIFDKAKSIKEYEDFAILENIFWTLQEDERKEIISIIENRIKKEVSLKNVFQWFLEKVKFV
jgi:DNA-binding transcriptional regulator YhcF (GntR family)